MRRILILQDALRRRRGAEEQLANMQGQREQFVGARDVLATKLTGVQVELDKLAPERSRTTVSRITEHHVIEPL